jgi:6-phosphogluconolactonase (cycloisomerase 2 family)
MKKRFFLFICAGIFFACTSRKEAPVLSGNEHLYLLIGSYSDGNTAGISVYDFDTQTGDVEYRSDVEGVINPSYLVVSHGGQRVYSVNETSDGGVSAFAFDKTAGTLRFINRQPTTGADPCYIHINKEETFLVTANYSGGSLSVFPLAPDGSIQPLSQYIDENVAGQESPASHIHTLCFSPEETQLLATDLGKDKIYSFSINYVAKDTFLIQEVEKTADLKTGSGPRHLAFHPNGKYLYSINELSGTVTAFNYTNGYLSAIQYIASDTTPGEGGKGSADIHISPDGKFLYSSNRLKADGIAVFSIDAETGYLTKAGYRETGIHPRNFVITPNGKFLLCANRDSNTVQVFERNEETGLLHDTGKVIRRDKPVCLKWIEI